MTTAIRSEALGKQYVVGGAEIHYSSFREMLSDAFYMPFRKFRSLSGQVDEEQKFWALRDVSFGVERGEVIGIIGRNGAGKSTLLKVLSRITTPTEGRVLVRGRVASLLEVGTGFHPELTGRENIYLNGSILGMSQREISAKFDEIVSFAEVERFVDTPVKRYSSGMYVRLAFSVAAFLESDILLVDEVLAVGDYMFQQRCLGKMNDVATDGRTIVFVTHNMGAINNLCSKVMVLEDGKIATTTADVSAGVEFYLARSTDPLTELNAGMFRGPLKGILEFRTLSLFQDEVETKALHPEKSIRFEVRGFVEQDFSDLDVSVAVFKNGVRLFSCHDSALSTPIKRGEFKSTICLPENVLRPGRYSMAIGARRVKGGEWIWGMDVAVFDVIEKWNKTCQERDEGTITITYKGTREQ